MIAESAQIIQVQIAGCAIVQYKSGYRQLSILRVRYAVNHRLFHEGIFIEHGFHFIRKNFHPRKIDDILFPSDNNQMTIIIDLPRSPVLNQPFFQHAFPALPG